MQIEIFARFVCLYHRCFPLVTPNCRILRERERFPTETSKTTTKTITITTKSTSEYLIYETIKTISLVNKDDKIKMSESFENESVSVRASQALGGANIW